MSSEDLGAGFRHKMAQIEREAEERLALIGSRVRKDLKESKEASDKQLRTVGQVIVRVQENARRAAKAGGWVMESTVGDKSKGEVSFGFEDDEAEKERRADYGPSEPAPQRPSTPPPTPAPAPPAPPSGRHRRGVHHDEDDFTNTDWLAT
ncbi:MULTISPECIES: hypothetical protein [Amycolatopsis]|uniref:Uncharacterized protein n=1 Tax=Amycolatopsis dendrobii TaxID=2760662 RepID=A0A7W3ZEA6_9PSEU|nr:MULTISPECIES: hypothetical protein [Amycolatopsis]MBB1157842.1 hypothetical protein [Amycolatopsis dendrobii]UKD53984.1 hypothetical protein L3Q65_39875 [Amycolatopsis sp. FU40]